MDFVDEHDALIGKANFLPCTFEGVLSMMLFQCPLPHPGVMFRRDAVLQAGNYRPRQPVEDLDLWLRLARVGKLVNLTDVVIKYRIHPGSVTATAKKAGYHTQRIFDCLGGGIPELHSISPKTYNRMLEKKQSLAILPLYAIACNIAKMSGVSVWQVLKSPEFLYSARCLTGKRDLFSKLVFFYFGRDPSISIVRHVMGRVFPRGESQCFNPAATTTSKAKE